jgi:hypothetical protein
MGDFSDLLSKTGDSIMQKSGLGKISNAIDRLRGKAKKGGGAQVPDYQGAMFVGAKDFRAIIKVPEEYARAPSISISPTIPSLQGVLFPNTPSISQEMSANYTTLNPTHSNYSLYFYKHSTPGPITVSGKFTVQNTEDAYLWIGTTHLLRALTKMRFGNDTDPGSPPPVCRFSAYGDYQYKNVPVVIQSFKVDLPDTVDYFVIPELTQTTGGTLGAGSAVPISSTITVVMLPMYSRRELLDQAQVGDYLTAGNNLRSRGFL